MLTVLALFILSICLYYYGTRNFKYWEKRKVKHDRPIPFFGNSLQSYFLQKNSSQLAVEAYWKYSKERFVGFFRNNKPELIIRDPDLIKQVLLTDFLHFYPRGINTEKGAIEPLLRNLFFADGDTWRLLRTRMTPAFTSGKLKAMFPLIIERAERLQERAEIAVNTGHPVEVRDLIARYTTDFIGACGFGINTDSQSEDKSLFRKLGVDIFNLSAKQILIIIMKKLFPKTFKSVKLLGHIENDMLLIVNNILKQRNYQASGRNDFIDLLLELRQSGKMIGNSIEYVNDDGTPKIVEMELDDLLMAAQVFIFFAAGFETSSSASSFTLHQLAFHPEVQKKVHKNIDSVLARYNNKLCYDAIKEMDYLEMAFKESMRIFPAVGFLIRQCVRDYKIPDSDVTIGDGVGIIIPIQAIQNDEQYFDNPTEFRPERFLPEEVNKRHKCVYLPFGDGPRACIGKNISLENIRVIFRILIT